MAVAYDTDAVTSAQGAFSNQYRSPLWQKKRLETLDAAGFQCQRCGDGDSHLHVHHKQYFKGRKVWEYTSDELEVLCKSCHEAAHDELNTLKRLIADLPSEAVDQVTSLLAGYCSFVKGPAASSNHAVDVAFDKPSVFTCAGMLAAMVVNADDTEKFDQAMRCFVKEAP